MALSWRRGSVVETDTIDTIADGVAGRCPIPEVLDDLLVVVDDVVLVGEEAIVAGMRLLYRHAGLVVEPSAALGIAAMLENRERFAGRRVATIICGSNVDHQRLRTLGAEPRPVLSDDRISAENSGLIEHRPRGRNHAADNCGSAGHVARRA